MRNGSSIIDLSPLIHRTGGYEAYDESEDDDSDTNPDFYINICQPLNPMHGLACPAGAAVCKVPVDGPPIVSVGDSRAEISCKICDNNLHVVFPAFNRVSYSSRKKGQVSRDCVLRDLGEG